MSFTQIELREVNHWLNDSALSLQYGGIESNAHVVATMVHDDGDWRTTNELRALASRMVNKAAADDQLATNPAFNAGFKAVFDTYPQIARAECNVVALLSDYALAWPEDRTLDLTKLVKMAGLPQVAERLAKDEDYYDKKQQENLETNEVSKMVTALTSKYINPATGEVGGANPIDRRLNQQKFEADEQRYLSMPLETLRAHYNEHLRIERLQNMSLDEIHAVVKGQDQQRLEQQMAFPPLPDQFEIPTKPGLFVPWSKTLLERLPHSEVSRLIKTYGNAQLDKAINQ